MKPDAGGQPPRHLSAVPGQRKTAAPGASRLAAGGSGTSGGSGSSGGSSSSGGSGGPKAPGKRRTRYTARAAILLLVFCALVLALAYPLQQYVSQSSQLDKIRKQNAEKAAEVARLKQQLADWQDPAYVEIQARKRLHYVKPGETGLRLLGPSDAAAAGGQTVPGSNGTAWYSQLWNSVSAAAGTPSPSGSTRSTGSTGSSGSTTPAPSTTAPSGAPSPSSGGR